MSYIERIIQLETNEVIERGYSEKEIAEVNANLAKAQLEAEAESVKATEKAALLAKLGITADEAKLLLS